MKSVKVKIKINIEIQPAMRGLYCGDASILRLQSVSEECLNERLMMMKGKTFLYSIRMCSTLNTNATSSRDCALTLVIHSDPLFSRSTRVSIECLFLLTSVWWKENLLEFKREISC